MEEVKEENSGPYKVPEEIEARGKAFGETLEIPPHDPFPVVRVETGEVYKVAEGKLWDVEFEDHEILLKCIHLQENYIFNNFSKDVEEVENSGKIRQLRAAQKELMRLYKKIVPLFSMRMAKGWHRWNDDILQLFVEQKTHHILWGSGNCGKSQTMALLLYVQWRVNPTQRMVIIANKVAKNSEARVFGYIKQIHKESPPDRRNKIDSLDGAKHNGIYTYLSKTYEDANGKMVTETDVNGLACITNLPVKVDAKANEIGANLIGRHPTEKLIIGFDEAQELPGVMRSMPVYLNWLTNENLDIHAWGNPVPVEWHNQDTHDLLFVLGRMNKGERAIKQWQKESDKTFIKKTKESTLLHLSMLDSPRDDPEEKENYIVTPDGRKTLRLHFIAGLERAEKIASDPGSGVDSKGYKAQVLGFPYINYTGDSTITVISRYMVDMSRKYPLRWRNPAGNRWFMGIDPSVTGDRDNFVIVAGQMGQMVDGRMGIDLLDGKYCKRVQQEEGKEFVDVAVDLMWEMSKSIGIPLMNICIETHSAGDVLRYSIQKHIEEGKWAKDVAQGQAYRIFNPTAGASERMLFKELGRLRKANDICSDSVTENWISVRCAIQSRQLFNVPDYILEQGYNRLLKNSTNSFSAKYKLESKKDMAARGVSSPDDFDALANLIHICRYSGFYYKYLKEFKYPEKYGDAYITKEKMEKIYSRVEMAGQMLGIGHFGNRIVGPGKGTNGGRGTKPKVVKDYIDAV